MLLDAVSAFGALPLDLSEQPEIDAAVFTSNKCLEGLPGLVFVIVRDDRILSLGQAGSWSFDLADILAQSKRDEGGSFRFTPAAQAVAAFDVALDCYEAEGGQKVRLARYRENTDILFRGMVDIGLRPCLAAENQGPIVINIHAPQDSAWSLPKFVVALKRRNFTISNFYNTAEPSFRVGCIGNVTSNDMRRFVCAVDESLRELGVVVRQGN
jgi:2-aminoethylphosphonate-pyruvate transaminase